MTDVREVEPLVSNSWEVAPGKTYIIQLRDTSVPYEACQELAERLLNNFGVRAIVLCTNSDLALYEVETEVPAVLQEKDPELTPEVIPE